MKIIMSITIEKELKENLDTILKKRLINRSVFISKLISDELGKENHNG